MERMAFDVIVVGGGAAGCVVAAGLAKSGSRSVLLLEAGLDLRANVPNEIRDGWHMTRDFDWGYASEPTDLGVVEPQRRVKLLGGTSSITRFALRGSPADFNEWAALGNPGWGFEEVLPYFRRLETDLDFGDKPWHGDDGPIPVSRYSDIERTEIHGAVLRAMEAVGFPVVDDHNRPGAIGVGPMPMNSRDGVRVTTAEAYLPVGTLRRNLMIRPDAQVSDIVLDGTRATGVHLLDGSVVEGRCVILSAGTYGSPPILMRSGIGPAEHLRSVGVTVRLDLPSVGANLADHSGVDLDCGYRGAGRAAPFLRSVATFRSHGTSSNAPPDLMLWPADPYGTPPRSTIDTVLLKPRSRGRVRLRSSDPSDPPRIYLPNHGEPSDLDRLVEGYRRAWEVAAQPEVRRLCADPLPPETRDPAELRRSIVAATYSLPHVVGTCAMGPSPDKGAVVDAVGRVHGMEQLFVVDASIIPTPPSGFTHFPTIMIAERLAEQIVALV